MIGDKENISDSGRPVVESRREEVNVHKQRVAASTHAEAFFRGLTCVFATTTVLCVFGALFYLQYHEIPALRRRLEVVETVCLASHAEVLVPVDRGRRQSTDDQIRAIVKQELANQVQCPACSSSEACCTSLSKPGYSGDNSTSTPLMTSYKGRDVMLPCNATGYPPPSIRFEPAPSGPRFTVTNEGLYIQNAQEQDSNNYTCIIENIFGAARKDMTLTIIEAVIVTTSPVRVQASVGNAFQITCDVSGSPLPDVTWVHTLPDGSTEKVTGYSHTSGHYVYTVAAATPTDAGSYVCTAGNKYQTENGSTTVTVDGTPQIVTTDSYQGVLEGSTITLRCDVISNPPATIQWHYPLTGDKPPLNAFVNPDNSLTLSNIDFFNTGNYTCTATNAKGSVLIHHGLLVEQLVTSVVSPHLAAMTNSTRVVSIHCTATGDPEPVKSWFRDSEDIKSLHVSRYLVLTGNMIITSPDVTTDTGVYTCYAENRNGNASDSTIVYNDLGSLDCSTTFKYSKALGCQDGQTCGGTCPSGCGAASAVMNAEYEGHTSICSAAVADGHTVNQQVFWKQGGVSATIVHPTDYQNIQNQHSVFIIG